MPQVVDQKALSRLLNYVGSYSLAKISHIFPMEHYPLSLCNNKIIGSCYCTFPMAKTICTYLSLQIVFL